MCRRCIVLGMTSTWEQASFQLCRGLPKILLPHILDGVSLGMTLGSLPETPVPMSLVLLMAWEDGEITGRSWRVFFPLMRACEKLVENDLFSPTKPESFLLMH
ncbi:hypothetical protein Ocin01_03862 [Orchesella cincta]|uniref:Uncharacterized protein n=1 Tax=Orchesella cincta TaxID=48709 RepID=A0A1D2NC58_ORCCI|nr:hypothetical protein Ocin01_03862 [Orchesella cincta]